MDEHSDDGPPRTGAPVARAGAVWYFLLVCMGLLLVRVTHAGTESSPIAGFTPWHEILTPSVLGATLLLAGFSFFFSASEVAYLALNKVRLRAMRESGNWFARLAARHMDHPGRLLTTILMGNNIVNILLSISFAEPLSQMFEKTFAMGTAQSYALSVVITTSSLVFFCELLPKVVSARQSVLCASLFSLPLYCVDTVMAPLRNLTMGLLGLIFRITKLSQIPPAPFLTDEEFKTLLSDGEASGVIEEEERQMIQGILEFSDVTLPEILLPRTDMVAVKETATVGEALDIVREHEFSRMPIYRDNLDHITGILYAKDLLQVLIHGNLDAPVTDYMHSAHFVPKTMRVSDFVTAAQRSRTHMAIVVDEYGGTEGLVTLQDALREVVGDIGDEDDIEKPLFEELGDGEYRVAGNYPIDEFGQRMNMAMEDEAHNTIGGFLMELSDKILEPGDELTYGGLHFMIEQVNEKRVQSILVHTASPATPAEDLD